MTTHSWQFTSRFRRRSFGWRSATPVQRVREAVKEIKQVARKEPVVAAEGAVILLETLSPALEQVDSSSGAIGSAVNKAIESLVPIIVKAKVEPHERQRWLERLWQALQDDDIPYIESLGDYWGELCAKPEVASYWADKFLPTLESTWNRTEPGFSYFTGTSACMASLYAAGHYEELLALINRSTHNWWDYRQLHQLTASSVAASASRSLVTGLIVRREFLGCLNGNTHPDISVKYPNRLRYVWRGKFTKNELLMIAGIYSKDGTHHVSGFRYV